MRLEARSGTPGQTRLIAVTGVLGDDATTDAGLFLDAVAGLTEPALVVLDLRELDLLTADGLRTLTAFVESLDRRGLRCHVVVSPGSVVDASIRAGGAVVRPLVFHDLDAAIGKDENEWLSEQFAELTGLLLAADSVDEVLRHIVTAAMVLIPAADLASITLRSPDGRFSTPARSDSIATELDEAQYRDGKGPCVEAARPDGPAYAVSEDLAGERRWPLFAKVALHHGLLSVMAIDLMPAGHPAPSGGAVNVYSRRRRGLTEHDRHMALLLSTHASLALAHTFAVEQGKAEHAHLRTAIESRDVIGQAKGILMARHGLTSDEAFDLLRRTSQHLNVKLADVAATFTERHRELEAP